MNDFLNDSSSIDNEVPKPIDSIIRVFISKNKLKAVIKIKPPENGGMAPDIDSIKMALAAKNISHGINEQALLNICEKPKYDTNILIARGTKPIHGIDGTYEILFRIVKGLKPKEREDGTVDFHNLTIVENVKKDQILCTITPPTKGIDGISVRNEVLTCVNGKPVPSLLGKNTRLSDDGTMIYATTNGQVNYNHGKIIVQETLLISGDVDNSTGNIKVAGNVLIHGIALPGFTVEAAGNIQINGGVNSATLIAGGDIILPSGINGGKIDCKGELTSRFIENCNVFVKGNINTDYVMNSNIKCGKTIQTTSSISRIVGGTYLAGENIEARIIGSNAGIRTYLELGTDSNLIVRQQELINEIALLGTQIQSLDSLISLLRQFESAKRLTPDKKIILDDAVFSHNKTTGLIKEKKEESDQILQSIKSSGYGNIISTGTVYPGTAIKIGNVRMRVHDPLFKKTFYHSEEGIRTKDTI